MDDPLSQNLVGSLILMGVLTLINAFLAGAEMAFVSLNQNKIKDLAEKNNKRAKKVLSLLDDSDAFLSAIQVGITVAGFLNSASASQAFVGRIAPYLAGIPAGETIATILVTLVLSYVTLVLGELYPKQLALQIPERYALASAGVISVMKTLFRPFIWLLTISTGLLKKITPIKFERKEERITRAEMKALLKNSRNDGVIDSDEFNMMRGVLSLDSKVVKEIMVPRVDAFMINILDNIDYNIKRIIDESYSRIPIYENEKDNILGFVTIKDVLLNIDKLKKKEISLLDIKRNAIVVLESSRVDDLLVKFKQSKQLMAIVIDEFSGLAGIVTLEDLVEEIVGEIDDEYDEVTKHYQVIDENTFIVKGGLSLSDFNHLFEMELDCEHYDTITGYIIETLGFIPKKEDKAQVDIEKYILIPEQIRGNRIYSIRVIKK
ncbi:putative hemolysin [Acholeplasma morum]|uniref:hemolysin family protein n=1 Tax=Paracholeplasma morum TaxID=264637 RepID=UPI0019568162|nr:hemolysin family protein [Paracholeplasma morum]MBM7453694.1 putative hemolysin [Paracholeplasma morum]